jgi:carbon storage regulator CsrA
MLVLTRRPNRGACSAILIGQQIELEVLGTESGGVKIGITAPESTNIKCADEVRGVPGRNIRPGRINHKRR